MGQEFKFNVVKDERKALVAAIGEITDCKPKYCGAPGFAFVVGGCTVSKDGIVTFEESQDADALTDLLTQLAERGFICKKEQDADLSDKTVNGGVEVVISADSGAAAVEVVVSCTDVFADADIEAKTVTDDETDGENSANDTPKGSEVSDNRDEGKLSIDVPLSGFSAARLFNLEKLITSKAWIFKKMTGSDELPIEQIEDRLCFPWFNKDASADEIDAYSRLITRLCETAKTKKRVVAEERPLEDGDNEKFKARCALLALGFIGQEYSKARKILLAPMSGNSAFKSGNRKRDDALEAPATADSAVVNENAITINKDENSANNAVINGENASYAYNPDLSGYDALMMGGGN